jgi:hypothetical protein
MLLPSCKATRATSASVRFSPSRRVLQDLGARPQTAFARAGVRLSLFRDPDARLPLEVAGRLFFESARLADCPHFALLVGERFNLDGLGPLAN